MTNEYRIIGPPGTGKTTTLARWVGAAAERFGGSRVLVSSFTKAAAKEIASRDLPVDAANVGTLHALCFRALGGPKIAEGEIESWNLYAPEYALSKRGTGMDDLMDVTDMPGAQRGDGLLADAGVLRAQMRDRDTWPDEVAVFQARWEAWKRENDLMDFTDLIEVALEDLPHAPGDPAVGFFDEVQDMSPLELALVRSWAPRMEFVVLAGDPDQAIYGFRGATPRAFMEPAVDDDHMRVLEQSYRVPKAVHERAVEWITASHKRHPTAYQPRELEGEVSVGRCSSSQPIAAAQAASVAARRGETTMILATCAYMLNAVRAELRRAGTPFHNPYRKQNGAWNPLRGFERRLLSLLAPSRELNGDSARMWDHRDLALWTDGLSAKGLLRRGMKSYILAHAKEERARANRRETVTPLNIEYTAALFEPDAWEQIHKAMVDDALLPWFRRNIVPSKRSRYDYCLSVVDNYGARALTVPPKVIIGTVHSCKGGEADHVWLFPDLSDAGFREWVGSADQQDGVRRVFYVGMTRARTSLHLCSPAARGGRGSIPSAVSWSA